MSGSVVPFDARRAIDHAEASLALARPPRDAQAVAGGPGPPHDPGMEARVASLESDMKDVKSTLGRMDLSLARIDATLAGLATKADLAGVTGAINALTERVAGQEKRVVGLESAINDTVRSAVGKAIGPWQLPGILLACGAVVLALMGALNWMAHQPWFAR